MAENKYHFERLTPTDSIDLSVYEEAIDYVFDNSDVRNVAISGPYSAGKSSVLASYKKRHSKLHFLHISLAHFDSPNENDITEKTEAKESVLEGKILNQLIHQIPSYKIPQTNFRVKKRIAPASTMMKAVECIALLIAIIYFIFFDSWKSYIATLPVNWLKLVLELSTHPYFLMMDGIVITALVSFIIYRLIKIQKNKNVFRKLNLQGNEIEIFEESDESYFDKYLNEVLYLFENVDADVIVFEDIDRFNANKIFERLREVNTLVNIQFQKENRKGKRPLRFFYLLRDDIFVSKDRTKFFDYIIPIIPVIDSSNSYDQFISHFKKGGLFEKFDESFLQGLSLYIDDMRLLKNIYNEFVIYFNRLNTTELDCNKMLAIIAYKNLFPRDFAELQLNQGFVYTLFNSKQKFILEEVNRLSEKISEIDHEIELTKKEHLKTLKELDAAFEDKKPIISWGGRGELSAADKKDYAERKQAIENRLNNSVPKMESEKSLLEQELALAQNKPLWKIVTRDNINKIFSITSTNEIGTVTYFNEIKSSEYFDLLKYLIRNGYIDETYADYMTYFYENSLSRIDKTFLRSVTDRKAKEYTYQLKNPALVVSRLRLVDFDQEEILNFDLLTYLLQTQSHNDYIERLIDQLRETKNFKFIGAYFETTTEMRAYIKYLNIRWPEIFNTFLEEKALSERQIRNYSIFSIYYSDDDTIKLINQDDCLRNYISAARDYLAIDKPIISKLIHAFKLLSVCFVGFNYKILNKDLFYEVYAESLYEINVENLRIIQTEVLGVKNDEDIIHKNYTLLLLHADSAITQYVTRNINEYFDVVLQISDGTILDTENVAITALNNPELKAECKYAYISALRTSIMVIKEINDVALWSRLLDADIVQYSERNIMDCFNAVGLNKSLICYINRCDIDLDFSKTQYDEEVKRKLFDSVVICSHIENLKYKQILASLEFVYNNFDIVGIPDDKFAILIDINIIKMTSNNLIFVRNNYPNRLFHFIHSDIEKYIDILDEALFSQEELLEILTWDISDKLKIMLLEFSNERISIVKKNYSPAVCLHILCNNFSESDLSYLFSSFEQWESSVQVKIFDYAVRYIARIADHPSSVSQQLIDKLFHSERVARDEKVNLFIAVIPVLSEDSRKDILTLLNLTDYLKIFDIHTRPKFEINDENEKLLAAFKKSNLIDNYEENSEKEGYYKITRRRPEKKALSKKTL